MQARSEAVKADEAFRQAMLAAIAAGEECAPTAVSQQRGGHEGAEIHSWRLMKEASASFLGTVTEAVHGDFFRVALDSGHRVLAKPAGKLQVHHIRLAIGDRVKVEISPYDPERGRIIQRL
jgi:translation initiation factor IF-1